jgi:hypothetical protein
MVSLLPFMLLTPLRAEVILLHSHCDDGTHLHQLNSTNSTDPQNRHSEEVTCCGAHETKGRADHECDHNQRPIVIKKGPVLAMHREQVPEARAAKAVQAALPAADWVGSPANVNPDSTIAGSPSPGPAGGSTTRNLLLRNHVLLF